MRQYLEEKVLSVYKQQVSTQAPAAPRSPAGGQGGGEPPSGAGGAGPAGGPAGEPGAGPDETTRGS